MSTLLAKLLLGPVGRATNLVSDAEARLVVLDRWHLAWRSHTAGRSKSFLFEALRPVRIGRCRVPFGNHLAA